VQDGTSLTADADRAHMRSLLTSQQIPADPVRHPQTQLETDWDAASAPLSTLNVAEVDNPVEAVFCAAPWYLQEFDFRHGILTILGMRNSKQ